MATDPVLQEADRPGRLLHEQKVRLLLRDQATTSSTAAPVRRSRFQLTILNGACARSAGRIGSAVARPERSGWAKLFIGPDSYLTGGSGATRRASTRRKLGRSLGASPICFCGGWPLWSQPGRSSVRPDVQERTLSRCRVRQKLAGRERPASWLAPACHFQRRLNAGFRRFQEVAAPIPSRFVELAASRSMHRPHGPPSLREPIPGDPRLQGAAYQEGGAIPAHEPRRDGRARVGRVRHRPGDRRRLCRSSELRHGHHRPTARSAGIPGRHHRAARLAIGGAVQGARQADAVLRRHRRQSRFDGEPLHGGPASPPSRRRLHGGRRRRPAAGPLDHRLHAALPRGLQGRADHPRGIEASLRRIAHYDYWSDKVRRSILADAKADLLIYGNAERAVVEVANRLAAGEAPQDLDSVRGVALFRRVPAHYTELPADDLDSTDEAASRRPGETVNPAPRLRAGQGRQGGLCPRLAGAAPGGQSRQRPPPRPAPRRPRPVAEPAAIPLSSEEMDAVYDLPYATRAPHPSYGDAKIPAWDMIKFSVTIMRGLLRRLHLLLHHRA